MNSTHFRRSWPELRPRGELREYSDDMCSWRRSGFAVKPRPESGLDCLTCATFCRQRYSKPMHLVETPVARTGARCHTNRPSISRSLARALARAVSHSLSLARPLYLSLSHSLSPSLSLSLSAVSIQRTAPLPSTKRTRENSTQNAVATQLARSCILKGERCSRECCPTDHQPSERDQLALFGSLTLHWSLPECGDLW